MAKWHPYLKGEPLPWLLEPDNPSVRYWTLTDILERPAADHAVREARTAIAHQAFVVAFSPAPPVSICPSWFTLEWGKIHYQDEQGRWLSRKCRDQPRKCRDQAVVLPRAPGRLRRAIDPVNGSHSMRCG